MSDSITFNKQKLQEVASKINSVKSGSDVPLNEIGVNLDEILKPENWSGPIADSAKTDLQNAKQAIEDIKKNMSEIDKLLSEAASNFSGINY